MEGGMLMGWGGDEAFYIAISFNPFLFSQGKGGFITRWFSITILFPWALRSQAIVVTMDDDDFDVLIESELGRDDFDVLFEFDFPVDLESELGRDAELGTMFFLLLPRTRVFPPPPSSAHFLLLFECPSSRACPS